MRVCVYACIRLDPAKVINVMNIVCVYTSFLLNGKINATQNKSHRDVVKVKASEQHFKVMCSQWYEMEKNAGP